MTGQKITFEIHDRKSRAAPQPKPSVVKFENNKRTDKLKKHSKLLGLELKLCGVYFAKAFVSLFKVLLYALIVLGDLLLIWQKGSKERAYNEPKEKKKNILDEGW